MENPVVSRGGGGGVAFLVVGQHSMGFLSFLTSSAITRWFVIVHNQIERALCVDRVGEKEKKKKKFLCV